METGIAVLVACLAANWRAPKPQLLEGFFKSFFGMLKILVRILVKILARILVKILVGEN